MDDRRSSETRPATEFDDHRTLEDLRRQAEEAARQRPSPPAEIPPERVADILHDLQVHQIELEMQNEELRRSRDELEKTRDEFARLYNEAPVGYISLDAQGRIEQFNETFRLMAGMDGRVLRGCALADLLVFDDRPLFLGRYGAFFRRPEEKVVEVRLKNQSTPVRITGRKGSNNTTLLAVVTDVSREARAIDEFSKIEQLWTQTFDAVNNALWLLDEQSKIIRFNNASVELLGEPPDNAHGCFCSVFAGPDHHDDLGCPFNRMRRTLHREHSIIRIRDRWLEVTVVPLLDDNGTLVGSLHLGKDVTDWRNAEDRIRQLLAEKELILREVHHRLKNNMATVGSLLTLHAGRIDNPEAVAALDDARVRLVGMSVLYDRLYRSETVQSIGTAEYVPLVIAQIAAQFESATRVTIHQDVDDFEIGGSVAFSLGMIVNELLTNAFKHAFPGNRRGTIEVALRLFAPKRARLTIGNDGEPLPDARQSLQPATGSGGFGLTLVETLVTQIAGSFQITDCQRPTFVVEFETKAQ